MNIVFYALAIGTLGALGTQASAQSQDLNRYEIGAPKQSHKGSLDGVVILDKRTGELWGWSEIDRNNLSRKNISIYRYWLNRPYYSS